jgi:hypothetical protein
MKNMLREHSEVRQIPGEPRRRWFTSNQFDLIVWLGDEGGFAGFELCYDRQHRERALVWRPASGFSHMAIDDGEARPGKHKATPVLVADGLFDVARVRADFARESTSLPKELADYVLARLDLYPGTTPRK